MHELTDDQRADLVRALEALVESLETQIASSAEAAKPVDLDQPIGRVTRIDALQQQTMDRANRQAARARLSLARAALERAADDEYGYCLVCGEAINPRRLQARPESPLCIQCQGARERR